MALDDLVQENAKLKAELAIWRDSSLHNQKTVMYWYKKHKTLLKKIEADQSAIKSS